MSTPYFFGYGSLVNRDTHTYGNAQTARLHGWRRVWRHTVWQTRPFLTVEPCPNTVIDGLIAHVPRDDWAALDHREAGYDRVPVTDQMHHSAPAPATIATYCVPEGKHAKPTRDLPIVLSYLDVVVQGYLREFGEAGAMRFFDTTRGWDAPVHDDRDNPVYPRHQKLRPNERDFVDTQLHRINAFLI